MANWTIRSKTEKTSLASTDGVPMQEAGGTTKWFSLSSLNNFFGISTLQGYFSDGWANVAHESVYMTMSVVDNSEIFSLLGSLFAAKTAPRYVRITADAQMAGMPYPAGQSIYYVEAEANAGGGYIRVKARAFGSRSEWEALKINGEWQYGTWTGNPATARWSQLTDASGNPIFPTVATTASAANAYIGANGTTILKSTSSAKYKTDIVTLDDSSTLDSLRPVLYKSNPETVPGDDPTKEHYGFIAEELHEIDEKLVQYVDGVPDGVQYDRITVLLVKRIHELEARLAKAGI